MARAADSASGRRESTTCRLAAGFAVALLLAGCSPEEPVMVVRTPDPSLVRSGYSGSFGLITVVAEAGGESAEGGGLRLSGQFVHYDGLHPDAVVRAVDPAVGRLPNEGVPGTCQPLPSGALAGSLPAGGAPGTFSIQLLAAGELTVAARDLQQAVDPREFPDLFPTVGGVVYGEALTALDLVDDRPSEVTVEGAGGADVGPFSAHISLPARPVIRSVDGVAAVAGRVHLGQPVEGPLQIEWDAGETGEPDFVLVELEGDGWGTVCRAPEPGRFVVPAATLRPASHLERLVVRIRRISVRPFAAAGIREGEAVGIVEHEALIVAASSG